MFMRTFARFGLVIALLALGAPKLFAYCYECNQLGQCTPVDFPKMGWSQCSTQTGYCVLSGHTCSPFGPQSIAADGSIIERQWAGYGRIGVLSRFDPFAKLPATFERNCQGMIVARLMSPNRSAKIRSSAHRINV